MENKDVIVKFFYSIYTETLENSINEYCSKYYKEYDFEFHYAIKNTNIMTVMLVMRRRCNNA